MLRLLFAVFFTTAFYQAVATFEGDVRSMPGYNVTLNGTNFFIGGYDDIEYQTWPRCLQLCNDMGMSLVSFQTQEKYELVFNYIRDFDPDTPNRRFWTGGMRLLDEYQWTSTGELATFIKWSQTTLVCETSAFCCLSFDIIEDVSMWDPVVMYPCLCEQLDP